MLCCVALLDLILEDSVGVGVMAVGLGTIFTAGLGNDSSKDVVEMVDNAGVTIVVDIRAWAHSKRHEDHDRKAIENLCKVLSVSYDWKLDLAPPPNLRRRFAGITKSKKNWGEYSTWFEEHLKTIEGKRGLSSIKHLVASGANVCLLCAEKHPDLCHRSLVAERLSHMMRVKIVHLVIGENPRVVSPRLITRQSALF